MSYLLVSKIHAFQVATDLVKQWGVTAFSKFLDIFDTSISSIQAAANSISEGLTYIAGFFEAEVKSVLENISTEFGKIYNTVPKLITDITANIKVQFNDLNRQMQDVQFL